MPFPRGVVDNDKLNVMRLAMEMACERLDLRPGDGDSRDRVALLVTGFMRAGEDDPERLTSFVVKQFKLPAP